MLEFIRIPYAGGYVDITWAVIGAILIAASLYFYIRSEKKDRRDMDAKMSH